jgi:hypothetical protein
VRRHVRERIVLDVTFTEFLLSALVAMALASVFVLGSLVRPAEFMRVGERTLVSFAAGMSAAYVFVHVLAELAEARVVISELDSVPRPFEGRIVYFVGLLGFLAAYGLDHHYHPGEAGSAEERRSLVRHIGGFALYVGLVAYLVVNGLDGAQHRLFGLAMAAHFLAINRTLDGEYGAAYSWRFRAVMSAAVLGGWMVGLGAGVPRSAIAMLLAFVSGAVIMNSAVSEITADREGSLGAFITGGVTFGLLLLALEAW